MATKRTNPKAKKSASKKRAAKASTKKAGEGVRKASAPKDTNTDSPPRKNSQCATYRLNGHLVRISIEADSEDGVKECNELLGAGFRTRENLKSWGMESSEWWQLKMFPSLGEDLESGLTKLISQRLGDDAESWASSLMWEITTVFTHLWSALHRLALESQNVNHQWNSERALGRVYAEARHNEQGSTPHPVTTKKEFRRRAYPFKDSRRPPDPKLVNWVSSRMSYERSIWEQAMVILIEAKLNGVWLKETRQEDGTTTREWRTVNTVADAWEKFDRDENRHGKSTLAEWFQDHPFRLKGLSFDEMSDFAILWDECLMPVLRLEWEEDIRLGRLEGIGETRFTAKFGHSKRKMTGYNLAESEWNYWWKETPKRMLGNHLEVRQRIKAAFTKRDGSGEEFAKSPLLST